MAYTYYVTPGHGYLKVPYVTCRGLPITDCSIHDGCTAYLEEDVDMQTWLKAYGRIRADGRADMHGIRTEHTDTDVYESCMTAGTFRTF